MAAVKAWRKIAGDAAGEELAKAQMEEIRAAIEGFQQDHGQTQFAADHQKEIAALLGKMSKQRTPTRTFEGKDIGATAVAGSVRIADDTFTIQGAGKDIWFGEDAFHFCHVPVDGNAEIVAQVTSIQKTHAYAKAAVMVRESLTASSKHALVAVSPSNGVIFQWRGETGLSMQNMTVDLAGKTPYWVRLVRSDKWLSGFVSPDGVSWTHANTVLIPMEKSHLGLAVCSHVEGALCTAEFQHVRVTELSDSSLPAGMQTADVGPMTVPGCAAWRDGVYTVVASGLDIWDVQDSFRFVYALRSGDFDVRARVVCIAQTNAWSKAGLMVRQSIEPGSANATVVASPANGILVSYRGRQDARTAKIGGVGTAAFPYAWVRLTRKGQTVRAYCASDEHGVQFEPVGEPVTLAGTDPVLVGLCASSHQPAKLTVAEFRDVEGLLPRDVAGDKDRPMPPSKRDP
jgi:hypothetical protein